MSWGKYSRWRGEIYPHRVMLSYNPCKLWRDDSVGARARVASKTNRASRKAAVDGSSSRVRMVLP